MANGDVSRITELGRFAIPGIGHNNVGQARNNKVMVWGRITGAYASTGITLTPFGGAAAALGLEALDHVSLTVRLSGADGAILPTTDKGFLANLTRDLDKIFVSDEIGAANPAVPTAGDVIVLDYVAFGEELCRAQV